MDKILIKQQIKSLIEKYQKTKDEGKIKTYTEEETKNAFIKPLFETLGWDFEEKNQVSAEERIFSSGRVDYGFYLNGRAQFYLEAKALKADLNNEEYAKQAIRYSFNKGVTWAVLTDFEDIKVFNAQGLSKYLGDKLYFEIKYLDYVNRFDKLWELSKESFEQGLIDKKAEEAGKKLQRVPITELLYKDLNECRTILTNYLGQWNPKVSKNLLDEGVQKLLDRLIFIRVVEDRKIEQDILAPLINQWKSLAGKNKPELYESMTHKFRELDEIYNSNLFSPHPFEHWEDDGGALEKIINILHGKGGYYEYDFSIMPADVLGSVYENYLGYKLSQSKKGLTLDKSAGKRKEQGIYYTPAFIVDYIVRNTLKPVLDKCKSIEDLHKIKVLDPACGSGSFLIKVLEVINEKYKEFGNPANEFTKIMILEQNIYGVDLDEQAVEIARLNLLLSTLETRMKLPKLDKNIKNGNSLISGSDEELEKYFGKNFKDKKPFNWQEEFPEVFKQGGFDVIISNPPWGAVIDKDLDWLEYKFPNSSKSHKDTYKAFIDNGLSILSSSGILGFIIPSGFLYQPRDKDIKELIEKYSNKIINLGDNIFKNVNAPCCIAIVDKSNPEKKSEVIDLTKEDRSDLTKQLQIVSSGNYIGSKAKNVVKKTDLTFDDVFWLKDAGIQYHRSGIGLSNKGGNNLYQRIFDKSGKSKFKESVKTWYGKLIDRYHVDEETDEFFNLDYKKILNANESVSFTREAFTQPEKILWRQTASGIKATLDYKKRWFRNTIQCGWIKDEYKKSVNLLYGLAIFNSKYIDYAYKGIALEVNRIFPQVKIAYLKKLPFVIGSVEQQKKLVNEASKMLKSYRDLNGITENSNKWNSIKEEIEKTDKKINEEVYKLYGLTPEEIAVVESKNGKEI